MTNVFEIRREQDLEALRDGIKREVEKVIKLLKANNRQAARESLKRKKLMELALDKGLRTFKQLTTTSEPAATWALADVAPTFSSTMLATCALFALIPLVAAVKK
eukprot:TRINITY_DN16611_c0_g1_i1.p2 TRINITY_DN16611_c0_g1~~TRINITY_DN16611_c0_g1_i1.p2  ORF type:complete len:105 (+),score=24.61 TRINITY_DN16611_c0_g1_i1:77-391(+)